MEVAGKTLKTQRTEQDVKDAIRAVTTPGTAFEDVQAAYKAWAQYYDQVRKKY